jgi:hypothetical protein
MEVGQVMLTAGELQAEGRRVWRLGPRERRFLFSVLCPRCDRPVAQVFRTLDAEVIVRFVDGGLPSADERSRHRALGARFDSPRGMKVVFDFPTRVDVLHPAQRGWCVEHGAAIWDHADILRVLRAARPQLRARAPEGCDD